MEIGIQVSSLKPLLLTTEQVETAFSKMQQLGCRTVQLQWIDPAVPVAAIATILKNHQIHSVSVQDFYETVMGNLDYYTELNAATGGTWLCVSRIPERLKTPEGLDTYIAELRALQKLLAPMGQQVCFHPVTADYVAVPGMDSVGYLLEHMLELKLCLDLFHLNRNCEDMPAYIQKYADRICMVHFKDSKGDQLVPAGQGDTNWDGVAKACIDAGVPYAFVEQERWDRDPFDCMKEAMDWLNNQI